MAKKPAAPFAPIEALLSAFDINHRINEYLLDNLPAEAWRAEPPAKKGRDIAGIIAHMHNVRVMWLKAVGGKMPDQLDKATVMPPHAKKALDASASALREVLQSSLDRDGRIKNFRPDAAAFFAYLVAHDAHHRGQIAMLARQSGHPLPQEAMFGMWEWGVR